MIRVETLNKKGAIVWRGLGMSATKIFGVAESVWEGGVRRILRMDVLLQNESSDAASDPVVQWRCAGSEDTFRSC